MTKLKIIICLYYFSSGIVMSQDNNPFNYRGQIFKDQQLILLRNLQANTSTKDTLEIINHSSQNASLKGYLPRSLYTALTRTNRSELGLHTFKISNRSKQLLSLAIKDSISIYALVDKLLISQIDTDEKEWMLSLFAILNAQESGRHIGLENLKYYEQTTGKEKRRTLIQMSTRGFEYCGFYCAMGSLFLAVIPSRKSVKVLQKKNNSALNNNKRKKP